MHLPSWDAIKAWFLKSEVIFWARLQIVVGAVWAALQATDLSPVLQGKYMTYWLIFSGVVTELLRRRGTEVRNGVIRSVDTMDK